MKPNDDSSLPALDDLGRQFAALAVAPAGGSRPATRRPSFGFALAAIALLVGFVALTPPGRSAAEAVGELVGIGDDAPTAPGEEAVYIGLGQTEEDFRYEVVATTNASQTGAPETCIFLRFPDAGATGEVGNCITGDDVRRDLEEGGALPFLYGAPDQFSSEAAIVMQAVVPSTIAEARITYRTADGESHNAPVFLSTLDEELSQRIGALDQAGFVVALLPDEILHGTADEPNQLTSECVVRSLEVVEMALFDSGGEVAYTINFGQPGYDRGLLALPPEGFSSSLFEGDAGPQARRHSDQACA